ncbi:TRAP transporter small permease subunit [Reyranella sp. CPCC 100927]|uniref:TRAP transporter small permease subunit n=1 Tax=Reyranella sp. CPCC 100927 TaxID=2599616 RepID=UPI0021065EA7|nr:TRAP transporter small permease [Reyranella sp. CPCC 100927]
MAAAHGTSPSAGRPPADAPLIARLDYWYGRLEEGLNLLAALSIFVLMIVGMIQILGRTVFDFPIDGYIDWIEFFAILYAIAGISYCQSQGGHIRMEIVLGTLRGRRLWFFESLAVVIGLVVIGLLVYSTWQNFERAWRIGDSSMDIKLPLWPAKLVVPVALATLWLRLLLQLAGYLRLFLDPTRTPVAVPVAQSMAEAARKEIDDAMRALEIEQRQRKRG